MRFLVVCCENSTAWNPVDFAQMFTSKLARDNSQWITVNIANNEPLPAPEDLEQFQGIVLTGSRFNVCDKESYPWFESICELIRNAASNGRPRVFGGCFGCQLIGHALGGEVSKNPSEKFVLKAEKIEPCQPFFSEIFPLSPEKSSLTLIESHGYCVSSLPPNSLRLAASSSCTNELFVCGANANLLACQCHPEFDYGYAIRDRIWPAVVEKSKRLSEEEIEESARTFETFSPEDSELFCQMISSFLHSTAPHPQSLCECRSGPFPSLSDSLPQLDEE
jgi:GMP synthase-like glutamine amidotransferase